MATDGTKPLSGRRILVTRRPAQAVELAARLSELGAQVIQIPAIDVMPPADWKPLDAALADIAAYDWIVFTSANAVRYVAERITACGLDDLFSGSGVRVAVVGPSTAAEYARFFRGAQVDLVPQDEYRADGLVAAFAEFECAGLRFLLPLGERAHDLLPRALSSRGAQVDVVTTYRTVAPPDLARRVSAALDAGIDLVTIASPSAAENLALAIGRRAANLPVVVIGPTTENRARGAGFDVRAVATPATLDGLIEAIVDCLAAVDLRE